MGKWRLLFVNLLIIMACASFAPAQQSKSKPASEVDNAIILLDSHIQHVTEDLVKDALSFSPSQRAILWSQLGDLLWKTDPVRGRQMLKRAVDELETAVKQKNTLDADQQLDKEQLVDIAQVVLRTVVARDKQLSERVLEQLAVLSEEALKGRDPGPSNNVAEALVESALLLLEKDAVRAAGLASLSLRYGESTKFPMLLIGLRKQNATLADKLFTQALDVAQAAQSVNLLAALTYVAFPRIFDPSLNIAVPADRLKAELLKAIAAGLAREDAASPTLSCDHANVLAKLLAEVDRLVLEQASFVRVTVAKCQTKSPRAEEALSANPPTTADDFLELADKATTVERRVFALVRASQAAANERDFPKAISILDNLTSKERETLGDTWQMMRRDVTTEAAVFYYLKTDLETMEKVINSAPPELRPFINLNLVESLVENKKGDAAFIRERLALIRQGLAKLNDPGLWLFYPYMTVARLYAVVEPAEAVGVVRDTVQMLNRARYATKPKKEAAEERASSWPLVPLKFPTTLLETYADELIETVSTIESPLIRARASFSVLSSLIEQRQERINRNKSREKR